MQRYVGKMFGVFQAMVLAGSLAGCDLPKYTEQTEFVQKAHSVQKGCERLCAWVSEAHRKDLVERQCTSPRVAPESKQLYRKTCLENCLQYMPIKPEVSNIK